MIPTRVPLAGLALAFTLVAIPRPSVAVSVETSCTGYARAVTEHLRPGAAKGTAEYRAVYFPTFDECMRRGGSKLMPGGLAAAPWYLPKPPAPTANPYTPTPPAAGPSAPPAPPANPNPPPIANPPAPPAGPTPAQILATGKQKVAQSLPGGMSFPLAVKAGLEGCGKFAIFQANATGANGSAKWQETASGAVNWCVQKGGAIDGAFTNSAHLSLALRMIKYRTAPASAFPRNAGVAGNHACAAIAGAPGYQSCVTEQGAWLICHNAACYLAEPTLAPAGAGEAVAVFHNCPGAQCRLPQPKPLASGQSLDAAAQARIVQCNAAANVAAAAAGAPGSPAWNLAGQSHAVQCLKSSQPPIVGVAASKKLQLTKGRECAVGEDGRTVYCVDDNGHLCVVEADGRCTPVVDGGSITVTLPPPSGEVSVSTVFFFNCPGGLCLNPPTTSDPRNPPGEPPIIMSERTWMERYRNCKRESGGNETLLRQCFMEKCLRIMVLTAGSEAAQELCRRTFDGLDTLERPDRWVIDDYKDVLKNIPERAVEFWESPAGKVVIGLGIAVGAIAIVVSGGGGLLLMGAGAGAAAVLIGVGDSSSGGAFTGKDYGVLGDKACRPSIQRMISGYPQVQALDSGNRRAVEDLFTELCALNLPDIAQIRAAQRGTYQACEQQSRSAQPVNGAPPIVAVSRQLNLCLRAHALQTAEKGLLQRADGERFADQWSALLRDCSASTGLQWRGPLQDGAAWPIGPAAGDPLAALSGCVVAGIR